MAANNLTAAQRLVQASGIALAKRYFPAKTTAPAVAASELDKALSLAFTAGGAPLRAWMRAVVYESKTNEPVAWTVSDAAGTSLAAALDKLLLTTAAAAATQTAVANKALTTSTTTTGAATTATPTAQAAVTTATNVGAGNSNMLWWVAGGLGLLFLMKGKKGRRRR